MILFLRVCFPEEKINLYFVKRKLKHKKQDQKKGFSFRAIRNSCNSNTVFNEGFFFLLYIYFSSYIYFSFFLDPNCRKRMRKIYA